ncbi:hypothetical protein Sjap_019913 [Stephania japonica]|uniref:Uncharacterized protein n=1 Tax=Stephania japonica TaxID=461633 RepID=A0AAP0I076_9MAGN
MHSEGEEGSEREEIERGAGRGDRERQQRQQMEAAAMANRGTSGSVVENLWGHALEFRSGTESRIDRAMADQKGPSDDSGTSSTRAVSIDEFQTLTQRVASQER